MHIGTGFKSTQGNSNPFIKNMVEQKRKQIQPNPVENKTPKAPPPQTSQAEQNSGGSGILNILGALGVMAGGFLLIDAIGKGRKQPEVSPGLKEDLARLQSDIKHLNSDIKKMNKGIKKMSKSEEDNLKNPFKKDGSKESRRDLNKKLNDLLTQWKKTTNERKREKLEKEMAKISSKL